MIVGLYGLVSENVLCFDSNSTRLNISEYVRIPLDLSTKCFRVGNNTATRASATADFTCTRIARREAVCFRPRDCRQFVKIIR